jgi:hypothetical protein
MRICEWLGLEYIPPRPPPGMDLDDEWLLMVEHARKWIEDIYRRLYEQEPTARDREDPCKCWGLISVGEKAVQAVRIRLRAGRGDTPQAQRR